MGIALNLSEYFLERAPVYQAIKSLSRTELSATAIIDKIREMDIGGVRDQPAYALIRELRGIQQQVSAIRSVPLSKRPSVSTIPVSERDLTSNYNVTLKFTGVHPDTGERVEQFLSYATDERLSVDDVADLLTPYLEGQNSNYPMLVEGYSLDSYEKASEDVFE